MASLDGLSDSELRRKLAEYGYPVGPVTETTRSILLKKLKLLMNNSKRSPSETNTRKNRRSLSRFSSGEEDSDGDDAAKSMPPPNSTVRSLRRRSAAGKTEVSSRRSVAETSVSYRRNDSSSSNDTLPPASPSQSLESRQPGNAIQTKYSRNYSPVDRSKPSLVGGDVEHRSSARNSDFTRSRQSTMQTDGFDTGSDSDVSEEIPSRITRNKTVKPSNDKPYTSLFNNISQNLTSKFFSSVVSGAKFEDKVRQNEQSSNASHYSSVISGPSSSPSFLGFNSRNKTLALESLTDSELREKLAEYGQPPVPITGVTRSILIRRLRTLMNSSGPTSVNTSNSPPSVFDVKESDDRMFTPNGHFVTGTNQDFSTEFKTQEDDAKFWNSQSISILLLLVAVLFFMVIGTMYVSMRYKESITQIASVNKSHHFTVCEAGNKDHIPEVNCIEKDDVQMAIDLYRVLYPAVLHRAVDTLCATMETAGGAISYIMSEEEAVQVLDNEKQLGLKIIKKSMRNVKLLLKDNPHWGVEMVGPDNQPVNDPNIACGLQAREPVLPFWCSIKLKLYAAVYVTLLIAGGVLVVFFLYKGVLWYTRWKERRRQEVYQMVNKVLEILSQNHAHAQPGTDAFIPINHVRDELIPPPERQKKAGLWEQAVKFLENDSRVRSEVQRLRGEEFKVWRWLPSISPTHPRRKVWQGQAFETMEGSVNSLPCSPTPCLKIRHMFDPEIEYGEQWPVRIKDAVLEKCEDVKIMHVEVDRSSNEGCVYVKCASQEDAGKAFRALHGWWFDGNLVTVKYLRLERYHERFPDSAHVMMPVRPSNNQRLSLQARFWQSPHERT